MSSDNPISDDVALLDSSHCLTYYPIYLLCVNLSTWLISLLVIISIFTFNVQSTFLGAMAIISSLGLICCRTLITLSIASKVESELIGSRITRQIAGCILIVDYIIMVLAVIVTVALGIISELK
uniref:Uncharacterized protein n=1 Tax=viral metagenome TaxID=1070528 RepID=A0A6C0BKL6_9ZZZZ